MILVSTPAFAALSLPDVKQLSGTIAALSTVPHLTMMVLVSALAIVL